jgi:hypothetical protein
MIPSGLREDSASDLVVFALRDPRCEPHAASVTDEEDGARTFGRHGRQRVVDTKVAVRLERHRGRRAVLNEGRLRFTDQRGEHSLVGVRSNAVCARQEQAAASHSDAAGHVDVRSKVGDSPRSGTGIDASDNVQPDIRQRGIGVCRTCAVLGWSNADAALEPRNEVARLRPDRPDRQQGTKNCCRFRRHCRYPTPFFFLARPRGRAAGIEAPPCGVNHRGTVNIPMGVTGRASAPTERALV